MIRGNMLWTRLSRGLFYPLPAVNLGAFRILFSLIVLGEVLQLWYFRHLVFDPVPYLETSFESASWLYLPWIAAVVCMVIGIRFRVAAIINYVYVVWLVTGTDTFLYHFDFTMVGTSACFIFMPMTRALSLEARNGSGSKSVPAICPILLLLLGLYLVYFDSIFHKLGPEMWLKGLSFWLPASLPQTSVFDLFPILDSQPISLAAGYLAFLTEVSFCLLVWWRPARWPLILLGSTLHIGIALVFPILWFGLGAAAFYLLLIPSTFWKRVGVYEPSYSREAEFPGRVVSIATACAIGVILFVQGSLIARYAPFRCLNSFYQQTFGRYGFSARATAAIHATAQRFGGFAPHPVYVDVHFREYDHIIAIRQPHPHEDDHIPLIDRAGHVGWYNSGRFFVYWSFRADAPQVSQGALRRGIKRYTAFWAGKQGMDLFSQKTSFPLFYKKVNGDFEWKPDVLRQALCDPWLPLTEAVWTDGHFYLDLPEIESL